MFISHLFYHFTNLLAFELFWRIILRAVYEVYQTWDSMEVLIRAEGVSYPTKSLASLTGASQTNREIWKRAIVRFVIAKGDVAKGLKQVYTLVFCQCSQHLRDKLETNNQYLVVLAAKDVIALDKLIYHQAHQTIYTMYKKSATAIEAKLSVLEFCQVALNLNDANFH